jgi:hypothetical protein
MATDRTGRVARELDAVSPPQPGPSRSLSRPGWALLVLLCLEAAFLAPVLRTGFLGDDSLNSLIDAQLWVGHEGIVQFLININDAVINVAGRLLTLSLLNDYAVPHFIHGLVLYKVSLVAETVAATALFAYVVRRIGGSRPTTYAAVIFTVACFQLRLYHESLVSYGGLVQTLLIYVLGSLVCFHRFLLGGRRVWLLAAAALYLTACLSYEAAYVFVLIHLVLALAVRGRPRAAIRATWPLLMLGVLFAGLIVYLRAAASAPDPNYAIALDPTLVLPTMAKQLVAALPLDYLALDPSRVFPDGLLSPLSWGGVLVAAIAFVVLLAVLRASPAPSARPWWLLPCVGSALWVLPALPLSLAPKYQNELVFGIGHLLVLIEDFGVGLLLALWAVWLMARVAHAPRLRLVAATMLAALGAAAIGATWQANLRVVSLQAPARDQRLLAEAAGDDGLFRGLGAGSTIVVDMADFGWPAVPNYPAYDWMSSGFFFLHGGPYAPTRMLDTVGVPSDYCADEGLGFTFLPRCPPATAPIYRVRVRSHGGQDGAVFLADVPARRPADAAALARQASSRTLAYVRAVGRFTIIGTAEDGALRRFPSGALVRIRSGVDWAIYELPPVALLPGSLDVTFGR